MAGDEVRVVYRKYDGSLHWHQRMLYLGVDEHGSWLGAGTGMITRKGDGPEVVMDHPTVILFPRDAWWTAAFNGPPDRLEIYCDITTPPQWPHPNEVTMVDLDLDVCRVRADGRVALLDEDEFADHQRQYAYPPEVIAHAIDAAAWLHTALSEYRQPFADGYERWLAKVT